ncbi:hypothetical protein EJ04DRAFT_578892 [Polyplosphaeria fusca]|uniref:Uncharacterized protein n=1 Tax=Polyplosphaeria fusca TaxID=682080 RepID=A0A9P4UX68_9PLEO|nr:hypothetical protein EJ04DRAFT_578892 [Polyplosphaeria fusca]
MIAPRLLALALMIAFPGVRSAGRDEFLDKRTKDGLNIPRAQSVDADLPIAMDSSVRSCQMVCKPNLCAGEAVLSGITTHLTYLCPEMSTTDGKQNTVFITVTELTTVTPTATILITEDGPATTSSGDKTTFITHEQKSTVVNTVTLHRTSTSTPGTETTNQGSQSGAVATYEPTTTITEHHISTHYITITVTSSRAASDFASYILSSANGTVLEGVSYTGPRNGTHYGMGTINGKFQRRHGETMYNGTHVYTATATTAVATPTGPPNDHPGATVKKMGSNGAGRRQVSLMTMAMTMAITGLIILF